MAIDPLAFISNLWASIQDLDTQEAVRDLSQKLQALAAATASVTATTTPSCRAHASAGFSSGSLGAFPVLTDTLEYDTAGEFNPTTSIWTPSVSGPYLISAGVGIQSAQNTSTLLELRLFNTATGATVAQLFEYLPPVSYGPRLQGCEVVNVTAGNAYQVRATNVASNQAIFGGIATTWFSATQLR